MVLAAALVFAMIGQGQAPPADVRRPPACGVTLASSTAIAELCLGEDQLRGADALPKQAPQRTRQLEMARLLLSRPLDDMPW